MSILKSVFESITNKKQIKELRSKALESFTVIFIIGGVGAGKNFIYNNYLSGIKLIDPDEHTLELADGDFEKQRKYINQSIKFVNNSIDNALKNKESIVVMGTGSNTKGLVNRIQKCKSAGAEVFLIFVKTSPEKAFLNNQKRIENGGRGKTIPDYKFESSFKKALNSYKEIEKNNICKTIVIEN